MKKMRGFVDPISLGFLLSAALATGATVSDKHHKSDAQAQSTQATQHVAVKGKVKHSSSQSAEFKFPFE